MVFCLFIVSYKFGFVKEYKSDSGCILKFIQTDKRKIHSLSTVRIYDIFLSKQQETIQNIKDNRY